MRVVAGRFRGRSLDAPAGDATRPTGARVKEALFSILGDIAELRVLDLYAGSGALGIEALSRGASFVTFVESSRHALLCLRHNLASLGAEAEARVIAARAEAASAQLALLGPFELVLCDPPWKNAAAALALLEGLTTAGIVKPGARVVLEHSAREQVEPDGKLRLSPGSPLELEDRRHWGDTAVTLMGVRSVS